MSQQRYFATGSEFEREKERLSILEQLSTTLHGVRLYSLGLVEVGDAVRSVQEVAP